MNAKDKNVKLRVNSKFPYITITYAALWGFCVVCAAVIALQMNYGVVEYDEIASALWIFVGIAAFSAVCVAVSLSLKVVQYEFSAETIKIKRLFKPLEVINVSDVESMRYLKATGKNIMRACFGSYLGGTTSYVFQCIYLKMNDGTQKPVRFIVAKDAMKLRAALYEDMEIVTDTNKMIDKK